MSEVEMYYGEALDWIDSGVLDTSTWSERSNVARSRTFGLDRASTGGSLMKSLLAVVLAVAGLGLAPTAHADEYEFLDRLGDAGIAVHDSRGTLVVGYGLCRALGDGYGAMDAYHFIRANSDLTPYQAEWFVADAMANLCVTEQT